MNSPVHPSSRSSGLGPEENTRLERGNNNSDNNGGAPNEIDIRSATKDAMSKNICVEPEIKKPSTCSVI